MSEVILHEFTIPQEPIESYPLPEPVDGRDTTVVLRNRRTGDEQQFVVTTFGDPSLMHENGVIVDATAYSTDYASAAERKRSGMLPSLGYFVVGVSIPGFQMTKNGRVSPFTSRQLEGLSEGDWQPYAKDAWRAIHTVVDKMAGRDNALSGVNLAYDNHSQGVSTGTAMLATSPDSSRNTHIINYEGIGWDLPRDFQEAALAMKWIRTGVQFMRGKKAMMRENGDAIDVTDFGKDGGPVMINRAVFKALGHANDLPVLLDGVKLPHSNGINVALWYGDKSLLSSAQANRRAAEYVRSVPDVGAVDLVVGHGEGHASEDHVRRSFARKKAFLSGQPYSQPEASAA